jgi:hypothetical protein
LELELPPVVVPPVDTNTYRVTLTWDDVNPPGSVDHFVVTLTPAKGGGGRSMIPVPQNATSNSIWHLSHTNSYTLTVRAVDADGLSSDESEPFAWEPAVTNVVTVWAEGTGQGPAKAGTPYGVGPVTLMTVVNPQGNTFFRLNGGLELAGGLAGPWVSVGAPVLAPGAYSLSIAATNNLARVRAMEVKE